MAVFFSAIRGGDCRRAVTGEDCWQAAVKDNRFNEYQIIKNIFICNDFGGLL
jgi:hypothetical protein